MRFTTTLVIAALVATMCFTTSFTSAPSVSGTDTLHNNLFTVGIGAGSIGGGYVKADNITIEIDMLDSYTVQVPSDKGFEQFDFKKNSAEDIKSVERGMKERGNK